MKTFKQITEADQIVANLYQKNPELKESKFGYAWKRFYELNIEPTYKKLKEDLADVSVDYALEDEKTKELLKDDQGNFKYSREGQKNLIKAQREILEKTDNKEIEVEPYFSSYIPEMSDTDREALEGLVIDASKSRKNAPKSNEKPKDDK